MNQKGFANIALIILLVLVLGGGVGYVVLTRNQEPAPTTEQSPTPSPITTQTPTSQTPPPTPVGENTNWQIYASSQFHFSIRYLKNIVVSEGTINGVGGMFPVIFFSDPSYTEEGIPYEVGKITVFKDNSVIQNNRPSNYPYYPHTTTTYLSEEAFKNIKTPTLRAESISINGISATKFIYTNESPSVFFYWIEHNDVALKIDLDKYGLYPRDTKDYLDVNSLQFAQ